MGLSFIVINRTGRKRLGYIKGNLERKGRERERKRDKGERERERKSRERERECTRERE